MSSDLESTSPRYLALLQLLRTADTVWNASRVFFGRWKLGPSQFNILNLLNAHPEGQTQTDLSRELIMHRSNITGLVDRLEKRGLVQRHDIPGDRRAYQVALTAAGIRLIEEILPLYYEAVGHAFDSVRSKQIADVTSVLEQVALNAKSFSTSLPA